MIQQHGRCSGEHERGGQDGSFTFHTVRREEPPYDIRPGVNIEPTERGRPGRDPLQRPLDFTAPDENKDTE
jgi:hypothetical protein